MKNPNRFIVTITRAGNPQAVEALEFQLPPDCAIAIYPAQETGLPLRMIVDGKDCPTNMLSTDEMVPGTAWEFDNVGRVIVQKAVMELERPAHAGFAAQPDHLVLVCESDASYTKRMDASMLATRRSLKFPGVAK